jgi:hypothetical protein
MGRGQRYHVRVQESPKAGYILNVDMMNAAPTHTFGSALDSQYVRPYPKGNNGFSES